MSIQLARRLIHADEYYKMAEAGILTEKDHVELIHGEIIEMSPIGNKHASIVLRLTKCFKGQSRKRCLDQCSASYPH